MIIVARQDGAWTGCIVQFPRSAEEGRDRWAVTKIASLYHPRTIGHEDRHGYNSARMHYPPVSPLERCRDEAPRVS